MAKRFDGKTALVTGGGRGIGKAIVTGLVENGACVFVIDKSKENLDRLKKEIPDINCIHVDISDWQKTRRAVEDIGAVDFLVNNAGILPKNAGFVETELESFESAININFMSAMNISQVVARGLLTSGKSGAIVNMSSVAAKCVRPGIAYCISKAMLEMMTKVMALELGPYKIRVNSIRPTLVRTDMTEEYCQTGGFEFEEYFQRHPMGSFANKQDVVNATLFLLSDESSMITGTPVPVDGGFLIS